ncbi:DUF6249 domain-containing protein [Dysgonomonas sp. 511]|uniref:DUF6249 domain-containing protein n=1 Tax=Dysgonomonas sp. 511 TaxID=2302930 RepID=UPI0013D177AD|nr:DUF6249 domain-containing protein [Dysgonomonas sp. 511]NDV77956.1 hypothetical protein [Dysgonomonas sp. 511]
MEDFMDGLIPILAIVCIFGLPVILGTFLIAKYIGAKRAERMELVRQGIIPPDSKQSTPNKYRSLRNGFLCIGVALGLIIGIILDVSFFSESDWNYLIVLSSVLLCLGLAYVAFFMAVKDKKDFDEVD